MSGIPNCPNCGAVMSKIPATRIGKDIWVCSTGRGHAIADTDTIHELHNLLRKVREYHARMQGNPPLSDLHQRAINKD